MRFDGLYDIGQVNSSSSGDFLGGPVVKFHASHTEGKASLSSQGNLIPQATRHGQKRKI